MWSKAGITWTSVQPGQGNVNFRCEDVNATSCPPGTGPHCVQAFFQPIGLLQPLGGPTAGPPGTHTILPSITESCTSWDGSPVPMPQPYVVQSDLMYTYSQARINIDWEGLWLTLGGGAGVPWVEARRHVRNVMIHELGHYFGFHHTPHYFRDGYDVMGTDRIDYHQYWRKTNLTLHPNLREAIKTLDMRTSGGLQIYDWDISCLGPGSVP